MLKTFDLHKSLFSVHPLLPKDKNSENVTSFKRFKTLMCICDIQEIQDEYK